MDLRTKHKIVHLVHLLFWPYIWYIDLLILWISIHSNLNVTLMKRQVKTGLITAPLATLLFTTICVFYFQFSWFYILIIYIVGMITREFEYNSITFKGGFFCTFVQAIVFSLIWSPVLSLLIRKIIGI